MPDLQYALVAYVRTPLGRFVEQLRSELHPVHSHVPAHVTVLPPRPLLGSEAAALEHLATVCKRIEPFEICIGEVHSFMPTTPTVFLQISRAAYKLRELHDVLNSDGLEFEESLPYMPHMTIGKLESLERAREVYSIAHDRWAAFQGSRCVMISELTFVRGRDHDWTDLAPVSLGSMPVAPSLL